MIFYNKIFKQIRLEQYIKLTTLAKQVSRSYSTVQKWENGTRVPSANDVKMLAIALNISIEKISDIQEFTEKNNCNTIISKDITNILNEIKIEQNINEILHIVEKYGDFPAANIKEFMALEKELKRITSENKNLKLKKKEFDSIFEFLPQIVYVKNSKLEYLFVNNSFISLLAGENFTYEKIIGKNSKNILNENLHKELYCYEKKALDRLESVYDVEIAIPHTNHNGLLNIVVDHSTSNEIKLVCTIEDIHFYKHKLNHLERVIDLFNTFDEYVYIKTLNPEKYLFHSYGLEKILGLNQAELNFMKESWMDRVHPDDTLVLNKFPTELENPIIKKYRIKRKDGNYIWVTNKQYYKKIENTKFYYGIVKDMTFDDDNKKSNIRNKIFQDKGEVVWVFNLENKSIFDLFGALTSIYGAEINNLKNNTCIDDWIQNIEVNDKIKVLNAIKNKEYKKIQEYKIVSKNGIVKKISSSISEYSENGIHYLSIIEKEIHC